MRILAIDTSCDDTAAAVTQNTRILSNIVWSQVSLHSQWGGVFPSVARRAHEEHINWVVKRALGNISIKDIDAIAVTAGPGLAVSLEVGIQKAKEIAITNHLPFIPINHIEGHLLSPLAISSKSIDVIKPKFPALGFVASGGTTQLILIDNIGQYKILATTIDDALGEALDKSARMLGLGYPGGAILEKMARLGDLNSFPVPIPMLGKADKMQFSYSGIKTAMYKLVESQKPLSKSSIYNLAASFQDKSFKHVENIIIEALKANTFKEFWFGGGVSANVELRKRIRRICKTHGILFRMPYTNKLCGDNAAMIGVVAGFKLSNNQFISPDTINRIDRVPRAKIDQSFT